MKPGDRILKLIEDFLIPVLIPKGLVFTKSQRRFKKKGEFFEFQIRWSTRKFNEGNTTVKFQIWIGVLSTKYRQWEADFYQLENEDPNIVEGTATEYLNDWDDKYSKHGWYDLVAFDNKDVMMKIVDNLEKIGLPYLDNFANISLATEELKKSHIKNFEKVVDFYILQNKWDEAVQFFENNKQWQVERELLEGKDSHSQYSLYKKPRFELRQKKLHNWLKQNI